MSLLLDFLSPKQGLPVAPFYVPRGAPEPAWRWIPSRNSSLASPSYLLRAPFYVPRGQGEPFWQIGPSASNAKALSTAAAPGQFPSRQFYVPRGWPDAPWVWVAPQNFVANYLYGGWPVGGEWSQDPTYEYAWQWAPPNATVTQPAAALPPGAFWQSSDDPAPETAWRWSPQNAMRPSVMPPISGDPWLIEPASQESFIWRWTPANGTVRQTAGTAANPFPGYAWGNGAPQDAVWRWSPLNATITTPVAGTPLHNALWSASAIQDTSLWRWTPANDTLRQPLATPMPIGGNWWSVDVAQEFVWIWRAPNVSSRAPIQKPTAQFYAPRGAHVTDWVWSPPAAFAVNYLYGGMPVGGMWSVEGPQATFWGWSPSNGIVTKNQTTQSSVPPAGGWWSVDAPQETFWSPVSFRWGAGMQNPVVISQAAVQIVAPSARRLIAPITRRALPIGSMNLSIGGPDMATVWTDVTTSQTLSASGGYVATTGGITLTLATSARSGPISIKAKAAPVIVEDANGALFDFVNSYFSLSVANEEVTLMWSTADSSWIVT